MPKLWCDFMKIRQQLIFFFSVIIIVSIGISVYFTISYTQSSMLDTEITKMQSQTSEVIHRINTLHDRASEDLVFALQNPKFVEYFELPETRAGNVFDENGVMQFTDNQREIKQELEQWIYHFQDKFTVDETCLIDTTGQEHARLVLSKIEVDEFLSPDEKSSPFFKPSFVKQKNEVHIQYPYVSPDTNRWVFAYASPVELGDGQKSAIFHFEMPITVFSDLLNVEDGRMYVLDPKGYVIADSGDLVSDTVIDVIPEKQFPPFQSVFAASSSDIFEEMISNEMGSGKYTVDGVKNYFVYKKLSTFDWILVYDKPTSLILLGNNSTTDLIISIGVVTVIVSIFGVLGVVLISSRVSKPISELAKEISSENPKKLKELKTSNQEIDQISHSVNNLIKKIIKYQEQVGLKNEELTIQKQQLERLATVGELASRMTHNLRNSLTVVKTSVDLLKHTSKDSLDDVSLERIDRIQSAVQNLEKQIEEVLTYVRKKPLETTDIKLNELIHSTLNHIDVPEGIEVVFINTENYITCDPDKLQIVFMNIITNAIEALKKNGRINIEYIFSNQQDLIQISDDGPGIPAENLMKIFDSLFTTKSTGTGLGLPYCKSVVEQHGGSITVSTNPTTFTISLPRRKKSKK